MMEMPTRAAKKAVTKGSVYSVTRCLAKTLVPA